MNKNKFLRFQSSSFQNRPESERVKKWEEKKDSSNTCVRSLRKNKKILDGTVTNPISFKEPFVYSVQQEKTNNVEFAK